MPKDKNFGLQINAKEVCTGWAHIHKRKALQRPNMCYIFRKQGFEYEYDMSHRNWGVVRGSNEMATGIKEMTQLLNRTVYFVSFSTPQGRAFNRRSASDNKADKFFSSYFKPLKKWNHITGDNHEHGEEKNISQKQHIFD